MGLILMIEGDILKKRAHDSSTRDKSILTIGSNARDVFPWQAGCVV